MQALILRVLIILPWVFLLWLFIQGVSGEMNLLLAIVLVIILIPVAGIINLVTMAIVKGRSFLKNVADIQKQAQQATSSAKPSKSERKHVKNKAEN